MSGHNKWTSIKHRKAAVDAKKGKAFSKVGRMITIAAREGGDPELNAKLRIAILKAKECMMPKENIERAISKGAGADAAALQELVYGGYASGGVAFIAEAVTDNSNRTTPEVRKTIESAGGKFDSKGSVVHMFKKKAVFEVKKEGVSMDDLMLATLEAGAEDITDEGETYEIVCEQENFGSVRNALEKNKYEITSQEMIRIAENQMEVEIDTLKKVLSLVERLEDLDDIQNVYTTAKITDEQMSKLQTD
jgi:YebC/PmpR family DNA-binding regulatory protein